MRTVRASRRDCSTTSMELATGDAELVRSLTNRRNSPIAISSIQSNRTGVRSCAVRNQTNAWCSERLQRLRAAHRARPDPILTISDQVSGAGTAGIWTAGASLSSNSKGKGWTVEGGVSTPGASVGGQGSTTTLLTKKPALPIHVRIQAQSDATSVIF